MKKILVLGVLSALFLVACSSGYKTGDNVWAEWQSESWWYGSVDGTCDAGWAVTFVDGDKGCYDSAKITVGNKPAAKLAVGDAVLAHWTDTNYWNAVIEEVTETGYKIKYTSDGSTKDVTFDQVMVK